MSLSSSGASKQESSGTQGGAAFASFQTKWLVVYLLAMLSDWLQGAHTHALYSSYGLADSDIRKIFVVGFGSSMVAGTFAGALSDKYGRKRMCVAFALLYILSALTKLVPSFFVLALGRVFSGIATSLLYSVFEAWMVSEHNKRGFAPELLSSTFSRATTFNGVVAVTAGLVAEFLADRFGYLAPFLAVIPPLLLLIALVASWPENYGNSSVDVAQTFSTAVAAMRADVRIVLLGASQSLFEGAMFTFVFMWSPALEATSPAGTAIPHGRIFATFMLCTMLGSQLFGRLAARGLATSLTPYVLHGLAAASMALAVVRFGDPATMYVAFLVFEVTCGMFWPTYGTLRSTVVPEGNRAAIANFFRVPTNAFVVLVLLNEKALSQRATFVVCCGAHVASIVLFTLFTMLPARGQAAPATGSTAKSTTGKVGASGKDSRKTR